MIRYTSERIYELLPSVYRQRDIENNQPLKDLLDLISDQVQYIEENIGSLYNNWFIETCDEWVIAYIGELVGIKNGLYFPLSSSSENPSRNVPSLRSFVANRTRYINRKGTVSILEHVARDITDWPAVAVEFFKSLTTTQNLNHLRLENKATVDLNNPNSLDLIDVPAFDTLTHTVDVRQINNKDDEPGYYNIQNIGIFLWRLRAFPVVDTPALNLGNGTYSFSPIGIDMPLYNNPSPLENEYSRAGEINVSSPIRRIALENNLGNYYAADGSKSIKIEVNGLTKNVEDIIVLDLSDSNKERKEGKHDHAVIPRGKVGIDPVVGRILLPTEEGNEGISTVRVSYYYGFSSELGGGFYPRPKSKKMDNYNDSQNTKNRSVNDGGDNDNLHNQPFKYLISQRMHKEGNNIYGSISDAIKKWSECKEPHKKIVFEIIDSEFYDEFIHLKLEDPAVDVKLCSSQLQLPHIRGNIIISANKNNRSVTLEGLHIDQTHCVDSENINGDNKQKSGEEHRIRPLIEIDGQGHLATLSILRCTMIPRRNKSIVLKSGNKDLVITLDHSICGQIDISKKSETRLKIIDSIVDGKAIEKSGNGKMIYNNEHILHDGILTCHEIDLVKNSTIFGKTSAVLIRLANNSIFTDPVNVEQKQIGCMRNCYVPKGSSVPRKYECQPTTDDDSEEQNKAKKEVHALHSSEVIHSRFTSEKYGEPGYAQLHNDIPLEISRGADNGSEMGVFNELRQYQRINILNLYLRDFMRFGMEFGIFCAS